MSDLVEIIDKYGSPPATIVRGIPAWSNRASRVGATGRYMGSLGLFG